MTNLLSKRQVAEILGIHEKTVDRHRSAGRLTYIKMGGLVRFRPEDVEAFLVRMTEKQRKAA